MSMISSIRVLMISLAIAIAQVMPASAMECYWPDLEIAPHQSREIVLEACPSATESGFEILEYGNEAIAKISLTRKSGDDGVFTITSVAPGETTFRVRWFHNYPYRMSICAVTVKVRES